MLSVTEKHGYSWKNWSGTSQSKPDKWLLPSSIEEVSSIVKEASELGKKIRVVGAGHSFTSLVSTSDWMISLDHLKGIIDVNEKEGVVTAWAGTRLFELGEELAKHGYVQENLGDINVQSLAGAISTGTHGTGKTFGNISTQVTELTVVMVSGEVITCSSEQNDAVFKAMQISLGILGIIVKVRLKFIKAPVYQLKSTRVTYKKVIEELDSYIDKNRHFEFFLFPYSDHVQVKTMNMVGNRPQSLFWQRIKTMIFENYLFLFLSELCCLFPSLCKSISRLSAKTIPTGTLTAFSHQLFATPRLVRFVEMEYNIPIENFKSALDEVRQMIEEQGYNVHFPIECRVVKEDDIPLSPAYKRDSAYLAFHMYKGMPYKDYFESMEKIMRKYDGRPHWGKMHTLNKDDFQTIYPLFGEFLTIRKQLDPDGLFLNEHLQTIFSD